MLPLGIVSTGPPPPPSHAARITTAATVSAVHIRRRTPGPAGPVPGPVGPVPAHGSVAEPARAEMNSAAAATANCIHALRGRSSIRLGVCLQSAATHGGPPERRESRLA